MLLHSWQNLIPTKPGPADNADILPPRCYKYASTTPGPAAACLCLFLSCSWLTACNMTGKCQNGDDKNSDCLLPDQESCSSRKLSFTVPDAWRYKFQTSVLICRIYCNLLLFLAWILTGATSVFNSCAKGGHVALISLATLESWPPRPHSSKKVGQNQEFFQNTVFVLFA